MIHIVITVAVAALMAGASLGVTKPEKTSLNVMPIPTTLQVQQAGLYSSADGDSTNILQ